MSDVSCRQFELYERAAEELGVPPERFLEGTTLSLEHVRDPASRAPWDQWVVLSENLEALIGPDEMLRWGTRVLDQDTTSNLRRLASVLFTPANVYRAAIFWLAPVLYPHLDIRCEPVDANHVVITIEIPEGLAEGAAWLRLIQGSLVAMPRMLSYPDARVQSDISPRRAVYNVRIQERGSLVRRGLDLAKTLGRPAALLGIFGEVQQSLADATAEVRQSREDLRRVIESLPDPVVLVSNGTIRRVNRAFRTTFLSAKALSPVGSSLLDLIDPDHQELAKALVEGRLGPSDRALLTGLYMRDASGRRVVVAPSMSTTVRFEGTPTRVLVLRDVTARRQLDASIAQAERVSALGTLAAGVAHDLNNPLASVVASLDLLEIRVERGGLETEQARELLRIAQEGSQRAAEITRTLVGFPRQDDGRGLVDVKSCLDAMAQLARNQIRHRATLVRDYQAAPPITGIRAQVGQAFLNLILNAAQALEVGSASENQIRLRTGTDEDGRCVVEVSDTGTGIEPEHLDRIFEPFFTTKGEEGTGLGLAMSRNIVEAHGGVLEVSSIVGVGTTVHVVFPPAEAEAAEDAPSEVGSAADATHTGRILVVDDEDSFREVVGRALDDFDVHIAGSGREALEFLDRTPEVHAVVCDIMMPDVTGPVFYEQVQSRWPELCSRFVFMTGGAFSPSTQQFVAGVDQPVLTKPFDMSDLKQILQELTQSTGQA